GRGGRLAPPQRRGRGTPARGGGAPPIAPPVGAPACGPGGPRYEVGPDPGFARAAARPSRFIRVMILPRALLGKSSLQFVDAADAAKPRVQQYKIFADVPIARPTG